jgi:hypothetical protein
MGVIKAVLVGVVTVWVGCAALAQPAEYAVALDSNSEYVQAGSDATFPPAGNESVTVEMWINIAALPSVAQGGSTLAGWGVEGYYGLHYLALSPAGSIEFNHWGAEFAYHASLTTGVWHHVCAVHDGAANRDYLYLDGTLFGSNATPPLAVGRTHVRLGQHPNVPSYSFYGAMDEVRIWSVARTAAEIKASLFQRLTLPAAGLAARWGLDDGAGSAAADSSGNSRTATLVGAPEWTLQVAPNSAAPAASGSFAVAQDSADDYLQIGADSAFPPVGNASMTIEMWFNASQLPLAGWGGMLAAWGRSGTGRMHYLALTPDGNVVFSHYGYDFYYPVGVSTGVWYHVCAVHDGDSNTDVVYINGQPKGTNTMPALDVRWTPVRLGQHPLAAGYTFLGRMDEVRIWSVARTPEEIAASMGLRLTASVAGLAGRWGFDEGTGNVAASSAGDYRPAVLAGSPVWASPGMPVEAASSGFAISAFDPATGSLTFGEVPAATRYRVEWADSLSSAAWSSNAPGLPVVLAKGAGSQTVTVGVAQAACFYRVVATLTNTAPGSVFSTFDADNEDWRVVSYPFIWHVQDPDTSPLNYDGTGNPAGSVRLGDVYGETGISAPSRYLGDKLPYYGGSLSYDILIRYTDGVSYPAVVLNGGDRSVYYPLPSPILNIWQPVTVPLAETGWKVSGTDEDATETFFKTVLSNLVGLYIYTEWHSGDDDTSVDNVTLAPP